MSKVIFSGISVHHNPNDRDQLIEILKDSFSEIADTEVWLSKYFIRGESEKEILLRFDCANHGFTKAIGIITIAFSLTENMYMKYKGGQPCLVLMSGYSWNSAIREFEGILSKLIITLN